MPKRRELPEEPATDMVTTWTITKRPRNAAEFNPDAPPTFAGDQAGLNKHIEARQMAEPSTEFRVDGKRVMRP